MDLTIGSTLRNLRRQSKMTQDELADALGVSSAAVSKWESGKTYPDITLLPSLARQLKTSIDQLLGFVTGPEPQDLEKIIQQCSAAFDRESFEKGSALCREYLNLYPNDITLKLHIGALIPMYLNNLPEDKKTQYLSESLELCKPAASSNDPELHQSGLRMLSSIYLKNGQLDLAEEGIHDYLINTDSEADPIMAVVLLKKGEIEKAEEIYQRCLFGAINDCQTALMGLSAIAEKNNNRNSYIKYLNSIPRLSAIFDLQDTPGIELNAYLSLVHFYAKNKQSEKLLDALDSFVKSALTWKKGVDISKNDFFDRLSSNNHPLTFDRSLSTAFTRIVEKLRSYDFLKENPRFEELAEKLLSLT